MVRGLTSSCPSFPPPSRPVTGHLWLRLPFSSPCHFHPCPSFESVSPQATSLKPVSPVKDPGSPNSTGGRNACDSSLSPNFYVSHLIFLYVTLRGSLPLGLPLSHSHRLHSAALTIFIKQILTMSLILKTFWCSVTHRLFGTRNISSLGHFLHSKNRYNNSEPLLLI